MNLINQIYCTSLGKAFLGIVLHHLSWLWPVGITILFLTTLYYVLEK